MYPFDDVIVTAMTSSLKVKEMKDWEITGVKKVFRYPFDDVIVTAMTSSLKVKEMKDWDYDDLE